MSSRWLISLTMVAACFVIILRVPTTARAQAAAPAAAKPTAALIDFDKAPLVSLLEAELLGGDAATWVERTEIAKVLDEQKLQTLFAPAAGSERARIGKVLKADVLVLIRSGRAENVPYLDVVVSEVTRGLRLVNQRVPETDNAEQDVARIVKLIAAGMQRHGEQIQAIYSVPPFLSEDLLYEHDDLRAAYARLVEQRLLEHPGILVVELAEAEAITKELTLAAEKLDRQLPIMLLGQYRNEGKGDDRHVTVQLAVKRGATEIGKNTQTLKPTEVPNHLREKTGLVASRLIGTESPVSDPKVEAQQLARRSKDFLKLGNWEEALALNQASLLLDPQQPDLHHDAVIILSKLVRRYFGYSEKVLLSDVQLGLSYYLRGVDHELKFYQTGGEAPLVSDVARSLWENRLAANGLNVHPRCSDEIQAFVESVRQVNFQRYLAHAEQHFAAGRDKQGSSFLQFAVGPLPAEAAYAARLHIIEKFQDLPNARKRAKTLALAGFTAHSLDKPIPRKLLAQLAASQNAELRAAAAELSEMRDVALKEAGTPLPPTTPQKSADTLSDVQVRIVPVKLDKFVQGSLSAGPGLDVFWSGGELYFMREKGVFTRVWNEKALNWHFPWNHEPRANGGVCFDGRYVWGAVTFYAEPPYLVVIDTTSDKAWKITTAEGLPFVKKEEADRNPQTLSLAPMAPGKVCAIGSFGRTWLATISITTGTPQIELFHEAKEQPKLENAEQWQDTKVAFMPTYAHVLTNPGDPGEKRLLIGRDSSNSHVQQHPLLVNPATLQVSAMTEVLGATLRPLSLCAYQGALYFQQGLPGGKKIGLFRLGLPGPTRELIGEFDCEGFLTVVGDQVVMVGEECWLINLKNKTLNSAGRMPWHYSKQYTPIVRFVPPPTPDTPQLEMLFPSQHYGLLTGVKQNDVTTLSQALFEKRTDTGKQP